MIQNSLKLTGIVALVASVVTGCSSAPINNVAPVTTAPKVNAVKVSNLSFNLGNKNGPSIQTKIGFTGNKPNFGIKAINDAFNNFASIDCVIVKLNKEGTDFNSDLTSTPLSRFTDYSGALGGNKATVMYQTASLGSPAGSPPVTNKVIKFNGLRTNTNYAVSARAYKFARVNALNTLSVSGGNTLTIDNTNTAPGTLATAALGDVVKVVDSSLAASYYEVVSSPTIVNANVQSTYTVVPIPAGSSTFTGVATGTFLLTSALSSDGSPGADSAATATAGGLVNTFGSSSPFNGPEEWVKINPAGTLLLANDETVSNAGIPGDSATGGFAASSGTLIPNEIWDVNLQLAKDNYASVDGNLEVNAGSAVSGAPESIIP